MASLSHAGKVRDTNQDACGEYVDARGRVCIVADGMGGHAVGDMASQMVVQRLNTLPPPTSLGTFVGQVREHLRDVNERLHQEALTRSERVIGSTVVALLAFEHRCVCLWAGDSRLYLFRDGRLSQLTRDHTQVEELLARGLLQPQDAHNHPAANAITRAVGGEGELNLDSELVTVREGDILMLCSDGLHNEVSSDEIGTILLRGRCQQASEELVNLALSRGARDNVSVIVVRADEEISTTKTILNPLFSETQDRSQ